MGVGEGEVDGDGEGDGDGFTLTFTVNTALRAVFPPAPCPSIVAVYFLAPRLFIQSLFGARFATAGHYIGWMGIAFGLYGAGYLTAMYLLSQKRHVGLLILGCALVLQMAGLYVFHASIARLITVQMVVFASAAAGLIAVAVAARPGSRRSPDPL